MDPTHRATTAIDVWTGRVCEIDLERLPKNAGRVFVWDDLFWKDRPFDDQIRDVLDIITSYLGASAGMRTDYRYQLDTKTNLSSTIAGLLQAPTFGPTVPNIALVNFNSAGPTPLSWPDIVPHLRKYYDVIVGFGSICGCGFSEHDSLLEYSYWSTCSYELSLCDIVCLTNDGLLGFDHPCETQERAPSLQNLINELIKSLCVKAGRIIRKTGSGTTWFAVGPCHFLPPNDNIRDLIDYQADIIGDGFCNPDHADPFELASSSQPRRIKNILFWPMLPRLPIEKNNLESELIGMRKLD